MDCNKVELSYIAHTLKVSGYDEIIETNDTVVFYTQYICGIMLVGSIRAKEENYLFNVALDYNDNETGLLYRTVSMNDSKGIDDCITTIISLVYTLKTIEKTSNDVITSMSVARKEYDADVAFKNTMKEVYSMLEKCGFKKRPNCYSKVVGDIVVSVYLNSVSYSCSVYCGKLSEYSNSTLVYERKLREDNYKTFVSDLRDRIEYLLANLKSPKQIIKELRKVL